jgi:hypothetical protein
LAFLFNKNIKIDVFASPPTLPFVTLANKGYHEKVDMK